MVLHIQFCRLMRPYVRVRTPLSYDGLSSKVVVQCLQDKCIPRSRLRVTRVTTLKEYTLTIVDDFSTTMEMTSKGQELSL